MKPQIIPTETIAQDILLIRGQKVILDHSVAKLYGVETGQINRQAKRNIERFPNDFMFQLNEEETLICQNGISNMGRGGRRYLPYAFTEQGVTMLSSVLKSKTAVEINIYIIRAFVRLRKMLSTHKDLMCKIEELERKSQEHEYHISSIFETIRDLLTPPKEEKKQIGFRPC